MPLKKDLAEFSALVCAGAVSFRNVVNEPELSAWLEAIATERLGPTGLAPEGAEPAKESKAREWLAKVARKRQIREGKSEDVSRSEASAPSSWSGLAWVRQALAEQRVLLRLVLPHEEREQIASVLDWMRSDEGPPASGDWTRVSFEQAVKAEHDWIEAQAKAFAKTKQDQEAGQGTKLFLDLSSLGAKWEGWRWVQVESALALDREGALMKHCVGSYAADVEEGRKEIYSLRDPQDKPKLTVEACGSTLSQLKGCANGACPAELREAVGAFAREFEKAVDLAGLGLVELSEDVEKAGFASLPGVGVFPIESGLSPEQRVRWEGQLSELAKGSEVDDEELVSVLAKTGMTQELSELLPFLNPESKHSLALSEASRGGHKATVEILLPLSDPLALDSRALRQSARGGHKEIVEMLLPVSDPLALDSWALRWAAREGRTEIVAMLLPVSAPLAADSWALRWAARGGHKEIVELLLPGSDPLASDSQALRMAAREGHQEIVERLLPWSDPLASDSQALCWAARGGHKEIVAMLLPGSDPLARGSEALREAAEGGHQEIVERLLPLSNPQARDSEALGMAAREGHQAIVQILLPLSDPLACDSWALRVAAGHGHKEIVEMLLPESDALARNSGALREAARAGHKEIVAMLAPSYRGDEETFHLLLKKAGMDSSEFQGATLGSGGDVQPMADSVAGKVMGRRPKSLPRELPRHPHGV